ncbi:MAG: hypothetical protein R2722_03770 [Tessaracoccus sp.]
MATHADGVTASSGGRRWMRALLPAVILLVWLIGAGLGGPKFGQVDEVSSNDPTAYLPSSADATRVQRRRPDSPTPTPSRPSSSSSRTSASATTI